MRLTKAAKGRGRVAGALPPATEISLNYTGTSADIIRVNCPSLKKKLLIVPLIIIKYIKSISVSYTVLKTILRKNCNRYVLGGKERAGLPLTSHLHYFLITETSNMK